MLFVFSHTLVYRLYLRLMWTLKYSVYFMLWVYYFVSIWIWWIWLGAFVGFILHWIGVFLRSWVWQLVLKTIHSYNMLCSCRQSSFDGCSSPTKICHLSDLWWGGWGSHTNKAVVFMFHFCPCRVSRQIPALREIKCRQVNTCRLRCWRKKQPLLVTLHLTKWFTIPWYIME